MDGLPEHKLEYFTIGGNQILNNLKSTNMRNRCNQKSIRTELVASSNPSRNQPCITRNLAEKDAKRAIMHPIERKILAFRKQPVIKASLLGDRILARLNEWNNKN